MDQTNSLRETVENDAAALGARASSFHPALVEIYGRLGLDFVWLDFEHAGVSPWNSAVFEDLTRAAEVGGIELFVRIPYGEPALIRKVLDAGVRNLLIPRVDDAAEVRRAVEATYFSYEGAPGERGVGGWRSSGYGSLFDGSYTDREDDNVMIGVMMEKKTAYENLDEILDVPELGFVFVGPGDLSTQLGHAEQRDHPEVEETIADIERRVRDSDVALAGIGHDGDVATDMIDRGYQIIRLGGEFESVQKTLTERMDRIEELGSR